ncbi:SCO family protein [Guyparkeria sp.]|uniref:SCO family protein n=1 Tax=Guyparkeria sp. TaxID=2035736 RepID=UPI00397104E2
MRHAVRTPPRPRLQAGGAALAIVTLVALLALTASGWWLFAGDRGEPEIDVAVLKPMPAPIALPEEELVTDDGETFGPADFKGKWTLLYFGYTLCPDICPVELGALRRVGQLLDEQHPGLAERTQRIFISVDPERDTPKRIRDFTGYFDPAIVGATGSEAALEAFAAPLGVGWSKRSNHYRDDSDRKETGDDYLVDHTTAILLVDPAARLRAVFPTPHGPQPMVDAFHRYQQAVEDTQP